MDYIDVIPLTSFFLMRGNAKIKTTNQKQQQPLFWSVYGRTMVINR